MGSITSKRQKKQPSGYQCQCYICVPNQRPLLATMGSPTTATPPPSSSDSGIGPSALTPPSSYSSLAGPLESARTDQSLESDSDSEFKDPSPTVIPTCRYTNRLRPRPLKRPPSTILDIPCSTASVILNLPELKQVEQEEEEGEKVEEEEEGEEEEEEKEEDDDDDQGDGDDDDDEAFTPTLPSLPSTSTAATLTTTRSLPKPTTTRPASIATPTSSQLCNPYENFSLNDDSSFRIDDYVHHEFKNQEFHGFVHKNSNLNAVIEMIMGGNQELSPFPNLFENQYPLTILEFDQFYTFRRLTNSSWLSFDIFQLVISSFEFQKSLKLKALQPSQSERRIMTTNHTKIDQCCSCPCQQPCFDMGEIRYKNLLETEIELLRLFRTYHQLVFSTSFQRQDLLPGLFFEIFKIIQDLLKISRNSSLVLQIDKVEEEKFWRGWVLLSRLNTYMILVDEKKIENYNDHQEFERKRFTLLRRLVKILEDGDQERK